MTIQFKTRKDYEISGRMMVHDTDYPTFEARLAMRFAEVILQASDYGRSVGDALSDRHPHEPKIAEAAVQSICKRACAMADYLTIEMRKREWIVQAPDINEVYPNDLQRHEV